MFHDAAKEVLALLGQPDFASLAVAFSSKNVGFRCSPRRVPDRDMRVAAIARQTLNGFGHERRAVAVLFGDAFCHELEEGMLVGGLERVVEIPIHFPLTVRVLVVVLVGTPTKFQHVIRNLADHIEATHERLLIVTRFRGGIVFVTDLVARRGQQKELRLDAGLDVHAHVSGLCNQLAQHVARGLFDIFAFHHAIAWHPCDFFVPRQNNHCVGVRYGQHVRVGRGQVEPCGKAREPCAVFLHVRYCAGRNQLGTLPAKQVGERDHEVFNAVVFGKFREVCGHGVIPCRLGVCYAFWS